MEQFSDGFTVDDNAASEQQRSLDESIILHSPDVVAILDRAGAVIEATEAFAELLGRARSDFVGTRFIDLLDPQSQPAFAIMWELRKFGQPDATRYRLRLRKAAENKRDIYVRTQYLLRDAYECLVVHVIQAHSTYSESPSPIAIDQEDSPARTRPLYHIDVIQQVTLAVTSSRQLPEMYKAIRQAIGQAIAVDMMLIGRVNPETGAVRAVFAADSNTSQSINEELPHFLRDVMWSGIPFSINEIPEQHSAALNRLGGSSQSVKAMLGAPLVLNEQVTGIIVAQSYDPDVYTELDTTLLGAVARAVAVAIERSQVIEDLKARLHRELRLRQMIDRIGDRLDTDDILDAAVEAIFEFRPNSITLIGLEDEHNQDLIVKRVLSQNSDIDSEDLPQIGDLVVTDSLAQSSFDESRQIYVPDIHNHAFSALHRVAELGGVSAVGTPIPGQMHPVGSIFVARSDVDAFSEHDLDLLRTVANLVGIWIRNAKVYRESHQRAQDLQDIQKISRIVASSLDVSQTLSELLKFVPRMLQADGCSVRILDGDDLVLAAGAGDVALSFADRIPIAQTESSNMPNDLQPTFRRDLRTDPNTRENVKTKGIRARGWAAAPLIDEHGKMFGALSVHTELPRDWSDRDKTLLTALAASASQAYRNAEVYEATRDVLRASIQSLAAAVDAKDPATFNHSRNVAAYARAIAKEMDTASESLDLVELAGLLHDVGKIGIPDRILQKPGRLDPHEWSTMRLHPVIGEQILSGNPNLAPLLPMIRHHHEHWDGSGYPDGLKGESIPLGAAIISLSDAIDTMTTERGYQARKEWDQALLEIRRARGTQFHPDVVDAFLEGSKAGHISKDLMSHAETDAAVFESLTTGKPMLDARSVLIFHRVAREVRDLSDLQQFMTNVVNILEEELDHQIVTVYLLNEQSGNLELFGRPDVPDGHTIEPEFGVIGMVAVTGNPITVQDARTDPIYKGSEFNSPGSEIAAPILADGRVIGVLNVESTRPFTFSDADERLLESTAALLSGTIQTARLHDELQRLSLTDSLTGLANHRGFYQRLDEELAIARERRVPLSVAILDVDGLKSINDSLGHLAGDAALIAIAEALKAGCRPNDLVSRYGGDEFAIILPYSGNHQTRQVIRRLNGLLQAQTYTFGGSELNLPGGAWGAASFPADGRRPAELVETADTRMYSSKQLGRAS